MKQRFAPFLVLLEARYAPLLFAVAPQAYAVYLWLFPHPYDVWGELFAVMGAIGYEFVYVGAIAWAEEDRSSVWTWATATVALIFSVVVAYYVYREQGEWAWLHAGFPLVAFTYTLNMYSKRPPAGISTAQIALETLPERSTLPELTDLGARAAEIATAAPVAPALERAQEPLAALELAEQAHYSCEHCGSELASKQAKGNASRFGCANLACPGRSNRKEVHRVK